MVGAIPLFITTSEVIKNLNSLNNDGATTIENINSDLLKDSSSNTTGNLNDMSEENL